MIITNYYYPPTERTNRRNPNHPNHYNTQPTPSESSTPLRILVIPRLQSIAEEKVRPSAVGLDDGSFLG